MHSGHCLFLSEPKANGESVKAVDTLTLFLEKLSSRNQNVIVVNNYA